MSWFIVVMVLLTNHKIEMKVLEPGFAQQAECRAAIIPRLQVERKNHASIGKERVISYIGDCMQRH